ncbi:type II 3-dehydroquinate dehydratase [Rubrivirga marina]|uniref:3-dehydroquinate dehydratase n=1 Tax=Rubrivirga marina TaxID=1196024 RepID=A0A271J569_9BACT|nr:type II 3-dehydroquinate dehydratase [Rubrivirga marina]PAP78105.1 type II 3-dehydroquinate dehydratase [Rubrivirga marina]
MPDSSAPPRPGILVLNGPNLNRLGQREPAVYGSLTLADVESTLRERFPDLALRFAQHNSEGALIDALHAADTVETAGVVFNPGGYAHTSVALRDAISSISTPVVEVHISNVYARESFRHTSLLSAVCAGLITGFGVAGYTMAVGYFERKTG